jgi:Protein of unknown function (DUF1118)
MCSVDLVGLKCGIQATSAMLNRRSVRRLEKLQVLSKLEKAGVLSALESNGITLQFIESNKLLSKAEASGAISLLTDR